MQQLIEGTHRFPWCTFIASVLKSLPLDLSWIKNLYLVSIHIAIVTPKCLKRYRKKIFVFYSLDGCLYEYIILENETMTFQFYRQMWEVRQWSKMFPFCLFEHNPDWKTEAFRNVCFYNVYKVREILQQNGYHTIIYFYYAVAIIFITTMS